MFRRTSRKPPEIPVCGSAYMVVAGLRFEVKAVILAEGSMKLVGYRDGPVAYARGYITVFGSDGRGIIQSAGDYEVPAAAAGEQVRYEAVMHPEGGAVPM